MKQFLKSLLILLLTLSCGNGYAQLQGQAKIDSLLKELPRQKEDTNKVKVLNALSYSYRNINPDEGLKYGQQDSDLAAKLDWKKGIADADNALGLNYQGKSGYTKALAYFSEALKKDEELDNKKGIPYVLGNIGLVYHYLGDYPKALEYDFKALKMQEEIGNKNGIALVSGNIGMVYMDQGDYPKALEYDFKAVKVDEDIGDKPGIAGITCNIGIVYNIQNDYPKALEYYFKALKIDEEIGDKQYMANVTGNIGNVYEARNNHTMAIEYFQKSLKMAQDLGNKYAAAANLINIGNTYIAIVKDTAAKMSPKAAGADIVTGAAELSVNKYQPTGFIPTGWAALLAGAIDYLQRGLAICKEIKALDYMQGCYEGLSDAYKLKGDYKLAMEYADDGKVIKDSVFSEANKEKIAKMEKAREQYGDSLKAVAAQRVADIKAQHRRNYEYIGAGVIVLLLGFTFLVTRNNKLLSKERKRSDNLLLNILPEEVADQLKDTGKSAAKQFDDVTVLFTDFVNFTEAGERMGPQALIEELDNCFKKFDEITGKYNVEKIKTIGDAYLAVAGLPAADPKHAENTVRAAIDINAFMQDRVAKLGNSTFEIRIGIHSGSVVAGIVGVKKFAYDIWGDTVNTAARMEQNSEAGKINISQTTYELVKDKFTCEYRGEIDAKGKGQMKMYFIVSHSFSEG